MTSLRLLLWDTLSEPSAPSPWLLDLNHIFLFLILRMWSLPPPLPAGRWSSSLGSQHQERSKQIFEGQTLKGTYVYMLHSVCLNNQPPWLSGQTWCIWSCDCCSCQSPHGCSTDWTSILWCHPEASSDSESWPQNQNCCIRVFILTGFSTDYSFAPQSLKSAGMVERTTWL